jgi:hypothetical protein
LNSGFKTKSEEIEWRRAKILGLKSQGLDQREMARVLRVSPATVTFDLQYLRKEARETIREYTTEQLPLQLKTFIVANQNAIKQYWEISQQAQDNKEKMQALEHYLDCHIISKNFVCRGSAYSPLLGVGVNRKSIGVIFLSVFI